MRRLCAILTLALVVGCAYVVRPTDARTTARFVTAPRAELEAVRRGTDVFAAGGIAKECGRAQFRATLVDAAHAVELAPLYSDCVAKSLGGLPAKLVWWDCGIVVRPVAATSSGGERWRAATELRCPPGYQFEWNVYEGRERYRTGQLFCLTRMPPQRTAGSSALRNLRGRHGEIAVSLDLRKIEYETLGFPLFCGARPGASRDDASYTAHFLLSASDYEGHQLSLSLRG